MVDVLKSVAAQDETSRTRVEVLEVTLARLRMT